MEAMRVQRNVMSSRSPTSRERSTACRLPEAREGRPLDLHTQDGEEGHRGTHVSPPSDSMGPRARGRAPPHRCAPGAHGSTIDARGRARRTGREQIIQSKSCFMSPRKRPYSSSRSRSSSSEPRYSFSKSTTSSSLTFTVTGRGGGGRDAGPVSNARAARARRRSTDRSAHRRTSLNCDLKKL